MEAAEAGGAPLGGYSEHVDDLIFFEEGREVSVEAIDEMLWDGLPATVSWAAATILYRMSLVGGHVSALLGTAEEKVEEGEYAELEGFDSGNEGAAPVRRDSGEDVLQ